MVSGQCRGQWRRRECGGGHGNGGVLVDVQAACEEEEGGRQGRVQPRKDVERVSIIAVHRNRITHTDGRFQFRHYFFFSCRHYFFSLGTIIHISITLIIIFVIISQKNIIIVIIINKNDDVEYRWAQNGDEIFFFFNDDTISHREHIIWLLISYK